MDSSKKVSLPMLPTCSTCNTLKQQDFKTEWEMLAFGVCGGGVFRGCERRRLLGGQRRAHTDWGSEGLPGKAALQKR